MYGRRRSPTEGTERRTSPGTRGQERRMSETVGENRAELGLGGMDRSGTEGQVQAWAKVRGQTGPTSQARVEERPKPGRRTSEDRPRLARRSGVLQTKCLTATDTKPRGRCYGLSNRTGDRTENRVHNGKADHEGRSRREEGGGEKGDTDILHEGCTCTAVGHIHEGQSSGLRNTEKAEGFSGGFALGDHDGRRRKRKERGRAGAEAWLSLTEARMPKTRGDTGAAPDTAGAEGQEYDGGGEAKAKQSATGWRAEASQTRRKHRAARASPDSTRPSHEQSLEDGEKIWRPG
ncbi:hypothetical protein DFH06DRAFT_1123597 [Mycena polygramma]|nr:hypothetical protein DFH06DRAFT_1123597 [Mycena polygramma]